VPAATLPHLHHAGGDELVNVGPDLGVVEVPLRVGRVVLQIIQHLRATNNLSLAWKFTVVMSDLEQRLQGEGVMEWFQMDELHGSAHDHCFLGGGGLELVCSRSNKQRWHWGRFDMGKGAESLKAWTTEFRCLATPILSEGGGHLAHDWVGHDPLHLGVLHGSRLPLLDVLVTGLPHAHLHTRRHT